MMIQLQSLREQVSPKGKKYFYIIFVTDFALLKTTTILYTLNYFSSTKRILFSIFLNREEIQNLMMPEMWLDFFFCCCLYYTLHTKKILFLWMGMRRKEVERGCQNHFTFNCSDFMRQPEERRREPEVDVIKQVLAAPTC